jgi:hypothetical protein
MGESWRFRGSIAGLGSTSGVRIVVGSWAASPYGAFADVMLAEPGGTRRLLAPNDEVAAFVSETYSFDDVRVVPVTVGLAGRRVEVSAGDLVLAFTVGRRTALGLALRLVPEPVATASWWSRVTDPVATSVLRGVRTRGSTGRGRTEVYGATDHHLVVSLAGGWRGVDLGALAPVRPEPRFGFGSTPQRPSVTTLVTTVLDHRPDRTSLSG